MLLYLCFSPSLSVFKPSLCRLWLFLMSYRYVAVSGPCRLSEFLTLTGAQKFNPFVAKTSQKQISTKYPNFTGREVWFERSHLRISSTDSKVRDTLKIKNTGSDRVNRDQALFSFCFLNKTLAGKVKQKFYMYISLPGSTQEGKWLFVQD